MSNSRFVALSRTALAGIHGKNNNRLSADIPDQLMADLSEALEMHREHAPTATRSELVREIIDQSLNGRIAALMRAFPGARGLGRDAVVATFAAMEGMTAEEYRDWVMDLHIFGRLHVSHEAMVGAESKTGNARKSSGLDVIAGGAR